MRCVIQSHMGTTISMVNSFQSNGSGDRTEEGMMRSRLALWALIGVLLGLVLFVEAAPAGAPAAGKLRTIEEATCSNPLTLQEVEALLQQHRGKKMTFFSYGGALQTAQREAFLKPFQERFGITVIEDSGSGLVARVRGAVDAKNVQWDIVHGNMTGVIALGSGGYLEEMDCRVVDNRHFFDTVKTKWGAGGGISFSLVLAYREGVKKPSSWVDFWDVKNFPGQRGIQQWPGAVLEFGLMAAGYTPQQITFPLTAEQEELAFRKLEELAPNISVFWASGSQCPEMLLRKELDYCTSYNGRIFDAQKQGAPLKVCWECGHVMNFDPLIIPKDAPNKEIAQLFIAWTSFPEINVRISKYISYGPTNKEAARLLPKEVDEKTLAELSTSPKNLPHGIAEDQLWLGQNFDRINERHLKIFGQKK